MLTPAEQQQVGDALEHDAEVMSNTQLQQQLAGQPGQTQDEIISINTDARHRALQVALLIPILAGLAGLFTSFRMMRIPEPSRRLPRRAWPWADDREPHSRMRDCGCAATLAMCPDICRVTPPRRGGACDGRGSGTS